MATMQATKTATLPPRLLRFFNRFPPQLYSAKFTGITIPLTKKAAKLAAASRPQDGIQQPINPVESTSSIPTPVPTTEGEEQSSAAASVSQFPANPFLPRKSFTTGKWQGPKYGLREQADLVKLAKKYGVEELLPPGRKSTAFKQQRLIEHGLRIRGTGEGQKVKGHKWERTQPERLEKRRKAMEGMPALIREWQSKGHGRGWKRFPKRNS